MSELAPEAQLWNVGGRERDEAEWRALLEAGGFEPLRIEDGLIEATCR